MRQHSLLPSTQSKFLAWLIGAICCWLISASFGSLQAQDEDEEELAIAEPEQLTLTTDDGVDLNVMWYAGGVARESDDKLRKIEGDKVVPVIILHGWGESDNESHRHFSAIATYLQSIGHAVLAPDLRGHGRSKVTIPIRGGEREKELQEFTKVDLALMVNDMVRLKRYLLEKNNAKELNIELLCVIASEESSVVAANWVVHDWSYPDLLGGRKQGKDIKGLILLSPTRSFNGFHWNDAMRHPVFSGMNPAAFTIPVLIITGSEDSQAYREAKTIHSRLSSSRKRLHQALKPEERREKHTLYLVERETELQGWKLLDPRLRLNLHTQIAGFIDFKLARKAGDYGFNGERKFRSSN